MKKLRKVSQEYYVKQIVCSWLVFSMLFVLPAQVAMAVEIPSADALPSGIINSTGINTPVITGLNMDITQTAGEAIINWNNFDIGADAGVQFIQPGSAAAVLNRVHDGNVTGIMGSLTANGRVFIINPAGMIFGGGSSVNVGALVASSLNLSDGDFISGLGGGTFNFTGGANAGPVENHGTMNADAIALIGKTVLNTGAITGDYVVMVAANQVTLIQPGSPVIVELANFDADGANALNNSGTVISDKLVLAAGDVWSQAISDVGDLSVVATQDAEFAGEVSVDGKLDVTAGDNIEFSANVQSGGDMTLIAGGDHTVPEAGDIGWEESNIWILNGTVTAGGDLTATAGDDIEFGDDVQAGGKMTLLALDDVEADGKLTTLGGDILITAGIPDIVSSSDGHNVDLAGDVTAAGDLTIKALDDVTAEANLESVHGNVEISASDNTIYLGGDVSADVADDGDIILWNNTVVADGVTLKAGDDIYVGGDDSYNDNDPESFKDKSLTGAGDLTLESGASGQGYGNIIIGGEVVTAGDLTMTAGSGTTIAGWRQSNVKVAGPVTTTGGAGTVGNGDLTVKAGDDIEFYGNVKSAGDMTLTAYDDVQTHNGANLETTNALRGDITIKAGDAVIQSNSVSKDVQLTGNVDSAETLSITAVDSVYLASDKTLVSSGNMTVTAGADIMLGVNYNSNLNSIDPTAGSGGEATAGGEMLMTAGNSVYAHGTLKTTNAANGKMTVNAGDDIILYAAESAIAEDDLTLNADTDGVDGDMIAKGTLTSVHGNVEISASDSTIYLHGNVTADVVDGGDIILWNNTVVSDGVILKAGDDIHVGGDDSVSGEHDSPAAENATISGYATKTLTGEGDLTLLAGQDGTKYGNILLGGTVETQSGGDLVMVAGTSSTGDLTVPKAGDTGWDESNVKIKGEVIADGKLDVTAGDDIEFSANVRSGDNMTLIALDDVETYDGASLTTTGLTGDGDMIITAGDDDLILTTNKPEHYVDIDGEIDSAGSLTVKADDDITLHEDATSAGTMTLIANEGAESRVHTDGKYGDDYGDLYAKGNLEGNMTLGGVNVTVDGTVYSHGSLRVDADENIKLKSDIYSAGQMKMTAGDNITLNQQSGDTTSGGRMWLDAGDDITIGKAYNDEGNVNANGNMRIWAGDGRYDDVKIYGKLTTTNGGNINVQAGDDIDIYGTWSDEIPSVYESVDADGTLTMIANTSGHGSLGGNLYVAGNVEGNMYLAGTNVTVDGDVTSFGTLDVKADKNIRLKMNVSSEDAMTMNAGRDIRLNQNGGETVSDSIVALIAGRDVKVEGNLTTTGDNAVGNTLVEAGRNIKFAGNVNVDGHLEASSGLNDQTWYSSGAGSIEADGDVIAASMQLEAGAGLPGYSNSHVTVNGLLQTTSGNMIVGAHHDITLNDVDSAGSIALNADRHPAAGGPDHTKGGDIVVNGTVNAKNTIDMLANNITLEGDVTSTNQMTITADTSPDYQGGLVGQVYANGELTSELGGIEITGDGIFMEKAVLAEGEIFIKGYTGGGYGQLYTYGSDATITSNAGIITLISDYELELGGDVDAFGNLVIRSVNFDLPTEYYDDGYIIADGDLISRTGDVSLFADDGSGGISLGGDVTANGSVLMDTHTNFFADEDQFVTAENGNITANGYLEKGSFISGDEQEAPSSGSLYLLAKQDISLADHVTVENGGISIIAETGKIFTPDEFGGETDTLNVDISGTSDHMAGIGVDLPKDYDQPAPDAAGEYETGLAAIVIMSEKALKLGPDGTLTARGTYYDDGSVDDRPGVDFANYDRDNKPGGEPIDIAIYLASNSEEPVDLPSFDYEGDVHVGSPVADLPDGAVMVVDAYDTVTFGEEFEKSLKDGNVDWLEVCSRISGTYEFAWNYDKLPKQDGAWDLDNYVWRGEGGGDDGGAWVLKPVLPADPRALVAVPRIEGCPELVQAAAVELGITAETVQIGIGNAIALSPSIQACQACAKLVDAATILRDQDGSRMAAMVQLFNAEAPAGAPFTPAMGASIAMAFESAADGSQYASAMEYVDAFAQYVAVLDVELGSPVGDSVAFVMQKHGAGITGSDNANIAAFVATRLEAIGR